MEIIHLGHSSFRIKGKTGILITDPYDPDSVGLKFPKVNADIVTISHNHPDHNRPDLVKDVKKVISGPGEYEISGISVIGISTYHDEEKGSERGSNCIYIMEIEEMKICHLGDLGHHLNENVIDSIGTIDILMIPIGGIYTLGPSKAAEVVRDIEPSIIIPMHYLVNGLNEKIFGKLSKLDDFLKELSLSVIKTDKYVIRKSDLSDEEQKVVVFEK